MEYQNPVIFADYSDPDVIRDGDRYILTASSFNYVPGLPILVSEDLVNWKLSGYALQEISESGTEGLPHEDSAAIGKRYEIPRHAQGVWAPSIRVHNGRYYIYYGMPDEGIYMVSASDPLGPWTMPVCVKQAKGFIDPCPYWDEDKAYIIHAYAKSRIGFKSMLGIFEMTEDGTKAVSEDSFIFDGNDPEHPAITIEGPKVYRRNGYYYILAPAGGVTRGWQTALRSKDIYGPYEIRTVMEQGNTIINGPHQGGLVEAADGREWFIHFQDRGVYGRITHLQPVIWKDGWPVIGSDEDQDGIGNPVYSFSCPKQGVSPEVQEDSDCFADHQMKLQWQWMGNLSESPLAPAMGDHGIALRALNLSGEEEPLLWHCSNVLTQKLVRPEFCLDAELDISGLQDGNRAGILMMGGQYAALYAEKENGRMMIRLIESEGDDAGKTETEKACFEVNDETLFLRMVFVRTSKAEVSAQGEVSIVNPRAEDLYFNQYDAEKPELRMFFRTGNKPFHDSGLRFIPSDHTWVGARTGLFAVSRKGALAGVAQVQSVTVTEL